MSTFQFQVTENDIDRYGMISGDMNPLHFDDAFARENGFSGRIAHGMLSMTKLLSAAEKKCLSPSQQIKNYEFTFLAPIYPGTVVEVTVSEKNKRFKVMGKCRGTVAIKGSFTCGE